MDINSGKPVVDTNFTYNPVTQTLEVANLLGTAKKAINDNNEQDICSTYVKYKSIKFRTSNELSFYKFKYSFIF